MTVETANRLYELRKKHNLSQEELAERLGVSRQAVSKWERSEASPDTDNLISLAKIYGLSLDELIYGKRDGAEDCKANEDSGYSAIDNNTTASSKDGGRNANKDSATDSSKETNSGKKESGNTAENYANTADEEDTSNDKGFYIDIEDSNNKVKIGPKGIVVEDENGETVTIGLGGIKIRSQNGATINETDGERVVNIGDDGQIKINVEHPENGKTKFWLEVPYAIICAAAYLIFGFYDILGGWALSWIVFITIPISYSLVESIYARRFSKFAYPVLATFIYLYLGLYHGNWHPSWIIFISIPIYYSVAHALDKIIKRKSRR